MLLAPSGLREINGDLVFPKKIRVGGRELYHLEILLGPTQELHETELGVPGQSVGQLLNVCNPKPTGHFGGMNFESSNLWFGQLLYVFDHLHGIEQDDCSMRPKVMDQEIRVVGQHGRPCEPCGLSTLSICFSGHNYRDICPRILLGLCETICRTLELFLNSLRAPPMLEIFQNRGHNKWVIGKIPPPCRQTANPPELERPH